MRLGRRQVKQDEVQVDLTPMLDIVFIMLIFFIVTSAFVRESGIEVERPQASHVIDKKEAGVFVAITANNEIFLDKQRVDVERLQSRLESVLLNTTSRSLVIQADDKALNGVVVKVMDAARGAGISQIALAADKP